MIINLNEGQKTHYQTSREREAKIKQMRQIIMSWNKKEIQSYVYNQNRTYPVCDAGMAAVLERFIHTDEFQIGHMSEELKMGFDIVLSICRNTKIYLKTTDLIYSFIKQFEEVIHSYDRQSAQTYYHKLMKGYETSVKLVERKMEIEKELSVKYR